MIVPITCGRCEKVVEVDMEPSDGNGDPHLLQITPIPAGWMPDPDSTTGGLINVECATAEELAEHVERLAWTELLLMGARNGEQP